MMTKKHLQRLVGVDDDGIIGPKSKRAIRAHFTNHNAPALTNADFEALAKRWGVPVGHIRGVRKVEAPRGPYNRDGTPAVLYERHKFRNNTQPVGRFNQSHPSLSGPPYGKGGYGGYDEQFDKFLRACELDPSAAFKACSWGAFQVLGENAVNLGYDSAYEMVKLLSKGEVEHLDCFRRFVEVNKLVDELQQCEPGNPKSCIPFVSKYNGEGYANFNYHIKLSEAIK